MLLLSSRYTSDSDLHAVFMSFLRRFLGVSRLVNLPNLNVVPVVPVVPRRLYPLSLFFFLISIRRRHPVSRLYSRLYSISFNFHTVFKQIPLYYAILSLSLLCDYRGFYAVMLPDLLFSSPLFADGLTFPTCTFPTCTELCILSHVYRVMFTESCLLCLSCYVYRVMLEQLDRFFG